jgi:hypothetical protein
MTQVDSSTDYWVVAGYMALIGLGVGMMMQNLVLAVQNLVRPQELGTASSLIAFTRTLGGAIGVSALGAVLNNRVASHLAEGLAAAKIDPRQAAGLGSGIVPDLSKIAQPARRVVEAAFGLSIADIFWAAAPCALIALVIAFFFKETKLRSAADSVPATAVQHADASSEEAGAIAATPVDEQAEDAASAKTGSAQSAQSAQADQRTDAGLSVSGTVRQDGGRTFAGAVITVTDQAGRQVARTRSDEDGAYAVPLPTGGTYVLIVVAEHVQPAASSVVVSGRPVVKDITLNGSSSVAGRVLTRRRQPAFSGASAASSNGHTPAVAAEALEGVEDAVITLTDIRGEVVGTTTTDEHGGYAFSQLMGGAYVLTAQSAGRRPLARAVFVPEAGQLDCDLRLAAGGRVAGTVVAASDGRRLPEASVTLVDADGSVVGTTVTSADGSYSFDDLSAGPYTVTAAGYAPVATQVEVAEEQVASTQFRLGDSR